MVERSYLNNGHYTRINDDGTTTIVRRDLYNKVQQGKEKPAIVYKEV